MLPPGVPLVEPRLKMSLFDPPSIWMLLNRSFCPATDRPTIWGAVLMKSVNERFSVGRRWMARSERNVDAPVRDGDVSGSDSALTVIPDTWTAARFRARSRTKRCPSATLKAVEVLGSKPSARAVRLYGPPTDVCSKL